MFKPLAQMGSALAKQLTPRASERYAEQLRKEFYEVLYKPLARTDIKVAGRFSSLIDELFFMASQTSRNLKGNS